MAEMTFQGEEARRQRHPRKFGPSYYACARPTYRPVSIEREYGAEIKSALRGDVAGEIDPCERAEIENGHGIPSQTPPTFQGATSLKSPIYDRGVAARFTEPDIFSYVTATITPSPLLSPHTPVEGARVQVYSALRAYHLRQLRDPIG